MLKHFTVPTPTPEAVVSDTPEWKCHFVREELAAILKDCAAPGTGSGRQSRVDPSEMSEQQRRRFAAYFYVGPGIDAQIAVELAGGSTPRTELERNLSLWSEGDDRGGGGGNK